jgi:hypothetical protein
MPTRSFHQFGFAIERSEEISKLLVRHGLISTLRIPAPVVTFILLTRCLLSPAKQSGGPESFFDPGQVSTEI